MRSQLPRLKTNLIVGKLVLLLVNFLLILALGEWLFPKFLDKIPLRLYGSIENNLRILAQHSKKNLLPNEYTAIVGDSIAVGVGDWLEEVSKNRFFGSPDHSAAHLIHKKTGIDVVSFGRAGAGSFDGIWLEPVTQFLYINSVRGYKLSPPKNFLIFFSEANDVYDNIQFLRQNFKPIREKQPRRIEFKKIKDFLNIESEKQLNEYSNNGLWKNMIFMRFLFRGTSNLTKEWFAPKKTCQNPTKPCHIEKLKKHNLLPKPLPQGKVNMTLLDGKPVKLNEALVNGKKIGLPISLHAPPQFGLTEFQKKLGLTDQLIELSMYVFNDSVTRLASFFPQSKINIIYVPSTVSSYSMVSSHIHYRGYMQDLDVGETAVAEEKHTKLCKTIKKFAELNNFSFVNTTKKLRQAALSDFIHGPLDWDHFNQRGYKVLSDDLAKLFLVKKEGIRMDNCVY